jgi:hypothetical protein
MKKCDEMREPKSCLNKAADDEPIFVLRAKDPRAAETVREWARTSIGIHEPSKIDEALKIADTMDEWRNLPERAS